MDSDSFSISLPSSKGVADRSALPPLASMY
jgi:hypothetical protein